MRARLRRYFLTGLIVFLPIAITLSFLLWLFRTLDRFLGWLFTLLLGEPVPGLGLVATIAVIFLIGALTTNVLGRRLVGWVDRLDRESTRLNSSHVRISYAVFCLKKKKTTASA